MIEELFGISSIKYSLFILIILSLSSSYFIFLALAIYLENKEFNLKKVSICILLLTMSLSIFYYLTIKSVGFVMLVFAAVLPVFIISEILKLYEDSYKTGQKVNLKKISEIINIKKVSKIYATALVLSLLIISTSAITMGF